ncbi:MAG: glycoside hydrolase family 5 protein [Oscillospiraceae bacterium]
MKKITSLFLSVIITVSIAMTACAKAADTGSDNREMRSEMTSAQFADEMGMGINLGNTMEAYWLAETRACSGASVIGENRPVNYETCWGAVPTTQECITGMKNAGFDTVRIPVYWGNKMAEDGSFTINEYWFARVDEIIEYCRSEGLYVVINVHHYDEFIIKHYSKDEALKIMQKIWKQIAEHYKNFSDYLIFEGYNENLGTVREGDDFTDDEKFEYVNEMNQVFVDTVRKTGGNNKNRMLIVSGYWTNIDLTTDSRFVIPEDKTPDRIMVSVHYIDNAMYWTNKIGGKEWLDYSRAQCELLKNAFTDKGIQVFVGECTSIYSDDRFAANAVHTDSTECLEIMYDMMAEYGFIPVLWDVNNNFYSRIKGEIISESDRALIKKLKENSK